MTTKLPPFVPPPQIIFELGKDYMDLVIQTKSRRTKYRMHSAEEVLTVALEMAMTATHVKKWQAPLEFREQLQNQLSIIRNACKNIRELK